jgi:hypothetical protein
MVQGQDAYEARHQVMAGERLPTDQQARIERWGEQTISAGLQHNISPKYNKL